MTDLAPCGTYGAYQQHHKKGEPPCEPCREASRAYSAARRAKGGKAIEREAASSRARSAALWRLAALHRAEFDLLVADEMRVEAARARAKAKR